MKKRASDRDGVLSDTNKLTYPLRENCETRETRYRRYAGGAEGPTGRQQQACGQLRPASFTCWLDFRVGDFFGWWSGTSTPQINCKLYFITIMAGIKKVLKLYLVDLITQAPRRGKQFANNMYTMKFYSALRKFQGARQCPHQVERKANTAVPSLTGNF